MKLKIDSIYGYTYHKSFNKVEVIARVKQGGKYFYKRLFFNTREEAEQLSPDDVLENRTTQSESDTHSL